MSTLKNRSYLISLLIFITLLSQTFAKVEYFHVKKLGYGQLKQVIVSHDKKMMYAATSSGVINVWNTTECKLIKTIPISNKAISRFAISQNDKILAIVSTDSVLNIFNLENEKLELIENSKKFDQYSLAISPDGSKIIRKSNDQYYQLDSLPSHRN